MLHRPPDPTKPAAAPAGDSPFVPVLLLGDPGVTVAVQGLLQSSPVRARVSKSASLGEALVAAAGDPPALAVIDGLLCEALEREFVDHLLRSHADTQVLLVGSDEAKPWPHPRLTRVLPHAVLPAVTRWLDSVGRVEGTSA
jgi:hypothetical protein